MVKNLIANELNSWWYVLFCLELHCRLIIKEMCNLRNTNHQPYGKTRTKSNVISLVLINNRLYKISHVLSICLFENQCSNNGNPKTCWNYTRKCKLKITLIIIICIHWWYPVTVDLDLVVLGQYKWIVCFSLSRMTLTIPSPTVPLHIKFRIWYIYGLLILIANIAWMSSNSMVGIVQIVVNVDRNWMLLAISFSLNKSHN